MLEELRNSCRPGQVWRQFLYIYNQSCLDMLEGGWVPAWSQTDRQCGCAAGDCGAQCRSTWRALWIWICNWYHFRLSKIIRMNPWLGNMAAFDMDDPQAVVSPGGVGFDINCGVRGTLFLSSYFASCRCGCWEPTWGRKTCSLWRSNWLSLSLTTFQWVGGWAWDGADCYCNLVVVVSIGGWWTLSVCVWW